jgi:hypothetical protein
MKSPNATLAFTLYPLVFSPCVTWCIAKTEGLHRSHRWSEVFKAQQLLCYGFLSHVSHSGTEPGYLPPSFPVPSWWLHKVKHKQHFCLNVRTLIPLMHPASSFEIKEYLPWSKSRDSYFSIKEEPGRDLNLIILSPILPGLSVVPGHSFPIFSTKANALFYALLTIFLTNFIHTFFPWSSASPKRRE